MRSQNVSRVVNSRESRIWEGRNNALFVIVLVSLMFKVVAENMQKSHEQTCDLTTPIRKLMGMQNVSKVVNSRAWTAQGPNNAIVVILLGSLNTRINYRNYCKTDKNS